MFVRVFDVCTTHFVWKLNSGRAVGMLFVLFAEFYTWRMVQPLRVVFGDSDKADVLCGTTISYVCLLLCATSLWDVMHFVL
jgi:hypothetical protein